MEIPAGRHWLDWYLATLNGETEHEDWKARRAERQAKAGSPGR